MLGRWHCVCKARAKKRALKVGVHACMILHRGTPWLINARNAFTRYNFVRSCYTSSAALLHTKAAANSSTK